MCFKCLGALALAAFPLFSGFAQTNSVAATPPLTPAAPAPNQPPPLHVGKPYGDLAEVEKLTKAGMGEDVILAFIKNSHSTFNLSADDILHLKEEGISAPVMTAMLTHDSALRHEAQFPPPAQFNYNQQAFPPSTTPTPGQPIASLSSQPDGSADKSQIATPPLVPTAAPDGSQPPPLQTEVVPVSPGPDYYWYPGYWGWNGGWIWIGGGWFPRGYYGWGWHGGWGWRGGWGGYHGGWGRSGWSGGSHSGGGGWGRAGHR